VIQQARDRGGEPVVVAKDTDRKDCKAIKISKGGAEEINQQYIFFSWHFCDGFSFGTERIKLIYKGA
jgi:hypothetical protein